MRITTNRLASRLLLFAALLAEPCAALAQTTRTSESASAPAFQPLERWKSAVLAGDKAALKAFYISDPRSFVQTPAGKNVDPANEEPQFWSALPAMGLTALTPKILEQASPQPGMVSLVLRVELVFKSKGGTHESLVSAAQVWVADGPNWRIFVTQRSDVEAMPAFRLPQPNVPNTHLYPEPEEAKKELDAALAISKVDHRRVLAIFGANWCYDCHVLDAALRSKDLSALVVNNYHVVHINIGDGDSNADLARRFQVPLNKGVPSLAVLDSDGNLITSQKNGEFESAAKIGMDDVKNFLNRWKPAPVK
jgi:thioredoxin 1